MNPELGNCFWTEVNQNYKTVRKQIYLDITKICNPLLPLDGWFRLLSAHSQYD